MSPTVARRAARALTVLMLVLLLVTFIYDLPWVRPSPVFTPWVDGWVQGGFFVAAAALGLLGAATRTQDVAVWWWVGAALATRALGFVLYLSVVRTMDPLPYPSVADAAWMTSVGCLTVALVLLVRARFTRISLGLALDGVVGALATSAVASAFLYETLVDRVEGGVPRAVVLTNLAYPVLDVMLLLVMVGALAAFRWQPPLSVWGLAIGVLGFVVVDSIFLVQVTAGTFRPGTLLVPFTMLTTGVIAWSGWLPEEPPAPSRKELPSLLVPAAFATICLGVLVDASAATVPPMSVILAAVGLLVVIVRTTLSFRVVRQAADDRREARTDELTGLANRRAFNERLEAALEERPGGEPLALLVVDLDRFKAVNDDLGHHNGDDVLRLVSARLQAGLRDEDFLARIGGDEFAIVLDRAGAGLATAVAQRLRLGLRRPVTVAGRELDVAASIGIAVFPQDGGVPDELLRHADQAMTEAKSSRSGHQVYRSDPHEAVLAREKSVERIRRAIHDEEIVLHYQPVVSLETGEVISVEALCRWQHPELGLVPPPAFLPLAESGGLMHQLTLSVLGQAVRRAAAWRADGTPTSIAVNLSVTNLLDVAFPDQLRTLLQDAGLPGESLQLELTEDLFMADPDRARRVIRELREAGVRLVVDDYGTGFSSIGYLRDLHEISGLKIDRSFVTHLAVDPRRAAIVESTISMAASLGLSVIAEGVETAAVRDRLADYGCRFAQGYLFSAAVPAEDVVLDHLASARARQP